MTRGFWSHVPDAAGSRPDQCSQTIHKERNRLCPKSLTAPLMCRTQRQACARLHKDPCPGFQWLPIRGELIVLYRSYRLVVSWPNVLLNIFSFKHHRRSGCCPTPLSLENLKTYMRHINDEGEKCFGCKLSTTDWSTLLQAVYWRILITAYIRPHSYRQRRPKGTAIGFRWKYRAPAGPQSQTRDTYVYGIAQIRDNMYAQSAAPLHLLYVYCWSVFGFHLRCFLSIFQKTLVHIDGHFF